MTTLHKLSDAERVSQSCAAFGIPRDMKLQFVRQLQTDSVAAIQEEIMWQAAVWAIEAERIGKTQAIPAVKARQGVTP